MSELIGIRLLSRAIAEERARVHRLRGREEIGAGFEFQLDLATAGLEELDEAKLLEEPAEIELSRGSRVERRIFGMVSAVRAALDSQGEHLEYHLTFVPRLFQTSLTTASEIFLGKSIPEIIQLKLERASLKNGEDFEFRLVESYAVRDFVMQYGESDHAFISRLSEHWGISIFFEHGNGKDVAIFSDDNSGFKTTPGLESAAFRLRGEAMGVYALESVTRTVPGKYVVEDYNYRTPSVALRGEGSVADGAGGSVTEFGPHCKTPDEASLLAKVRAEEIACRRRVVEGSSDLIAMASGGRTTLDGHPKMDGEVLVISIEHEADVPVFGRGGTEQRYKNAFVAIPAKTSFGPRRLTPKPKIHGAITAVIEAAQAGQYADLDDDGRYHVRFKFDGGDHPKGQASKLVRMAQPHAGAGYGMHFPLRDGVEVLLTCIDGDPDRPIITGAVPNPQTPSVVSSANGVRNVIRSGGGTELNIDDTDGQTRFKITVPHKNTFFQMGSPNDPTEGCSVGTDQDIKHTSGNNYRVQAGVNLGLSAGTKIWESAPTTEIYGTTRLHLEGDAVEIKGNVTIDAQAPAISLAGDNIIKETAPIIELKALGSLMGTATTITLKGDGLNQVSSNAMVQVVSGGAVLISAHGAIVVSAPTVQVNGSGTVNINGGSVNLNC